MKCLGQKIVGEDTRPASMDLIKTYLLCFVLTLKMIRSQKEIRQEASGNEK